MDNCEKCEMLFEELLEDELTAEEREFMDKHLAECADCRSSLEDEKIMLNMSERREELSSGFPADFDDRLYSRMVEEGVIDENGMEESGKGAVYLLTRPWVRQSLTAAALLLIGVFIGGYFFSSDSDIPANITEGNSYLVSDSAQSQKLIQRASSFLDKSRVILLAIENFDPDTEETESLDLAFQKKISKRLISQASLLKRDLNRNKQKRLRELISDLEVILLQIANYDSGSEMETLQLVKGDRYINGMLYRIRLNDLRRLDKNRQNKVNRF